jgi:hypothetical protein
MFEQETFMSLLRDRAHWEFELFLMALFDGLIGALLWPFVRKHWRHHVWRDVRDFDHAALNAAVAAQMSQEFVKRTDPEPRPGVWHWTPEGENNVQN